MANKQIKSQKMVEKAVGSFTSALEQVEKAQELLAASISEDMSGIESNNDKIELLESENRSIEESIKSKELEMEQNRKLEAQLQAFTK